MKRQKYYRYRVTKVVTQKTKPTVKVGDVLLYKQGRGPFHFETIMKRSTGQIVEVWHMEAIGPCWAIGKKIVERRDYAKRQSA